MEQLLHYVWKHKLFPLQSLVTVQGQAVEVIDPGLPNTDAGPDFFNAKVKLDGTLWVGTVELHLHTSDWYRHGHSSDAKYHSVILHVAEEDDAQPILRPDGTALPLLLLPIPERLRTGYEQLLRCDQYPPCYHLLPTLSPLLMHSWMSSLLAERMAERSARVEERVEQCDGNWEDAFFATLARNFGFGVNGDAFEAWARHVPLRAVDKHRDNLFQVEAIFFGQAGLLEEDEREHPDERTANSSYYRDLQREYRYLAHKFDLHPMDASRWNFLRLRPYNFPYVRIAQLACLYQKSYGLLSRVLEAPTRPELHALLRAEASPYWRTHCEFGGGAALSRAKTLTPASLDLLLINTVAPFLYAYGRHKAEDALCLRAGQLLEAIKPEGNRITRMWAECGVNCAHAGDSQALIQLKREYCDAKKCLYCRIGYHYLKKIPY
jgi:hypothetical protein